MGDFENKKRIVNEENVKLVGLENIELFSSVTKLEDFPIPTQILKQTTKYKKIKSNSKEETKLEDFPIINIKPVKNQEHKEKTRRNR